MTNGKLLLTKREVAEVLGVCERTVERRTKDQTLIAVRLGPKQIRWPVDKLKESIDQLAATTT